MGNLSPRLPIMLAKPFVGLRQQKPDKSALYAAFNYVVRTARAVGTGVS